MNQPQPVARNLYATIADIGKERIRRVIAKLRKADEGKLFTSGASGAAREPTEAGEPSRVSGRVLDDVESKHETVDETRPLTRLGSPASVGSPELGEDLGFKVFKLAESHFESWAGVPERDPAKYHEAMSLFRDPLRAGWTPEGLLWEVAVKEGYGLNCRIERVVCAKNAVYRVTDPEKDPPQSFRACLDDALQPDIANELELGTEDLFVAGDRALDDTLAANLALQCRLKTI